MQIAWIHIIKKCFKTIDIFGAPIKFNIDGKATYQSAVGGIMTLAMFAVIFVFFQSQIRNFFERKNIYVEQSLKFSSSPLPLILDNKNFMFAIAVEQPIDYPFNQKPFFNIIMRQSQYDRSKQPEERKTIEVPLETCSLERFQLYSKKTDHEKLKETYDKFKFSSYLCPRDDFAFNISGAFLDTQFNFISIQIVDCVDNQNQICAPKEVVDEYYKQKGFFRLNFYTTNYQINPADVVDPAQLFIAEDLNFIFQPGLVEKKIDVFYSSYEVETDKSLFVLPQITSETYIYRGVDSFREQNVNHNTESLSPVTVYLRSNYVQNYAFRRYMKIDELLSYFGGIFHIFFLMIGLFMIAYNRHFLKIRLANKLYDFKDYQNSKQRNNPDDKVRNINALLKSVNVNGIRKCQSQIYQGDQLNDIKVEIQQGGQKVQAKLSDVTDSKKIKEFGFQSKQDFLIWYFQKILMSRIKLKATLTYVIYKLSFNKFFVTNKNRLLDKSIKQIDDDMNIKNLMNNVTQIDKLKRLILNQDQIILFNFFPKPQITLQEKIRIVYDTQEMNDSAQLINKQNEQPQLQQQQVSRKYRHDFKDFQILIQAFDNIRNDLSKDETMQIINSKLIYLLGSELKSVFKACIIFQTGQDIKESIKLISNQQKVEDEELKEIKQSFFVSQIIQQQNDIALDSKAS